MGRAREAPEQTERHGKDRPLGHSPSCRADQRCLGTYGGDRLVRRTVVARKAVSRRVVDLRVQLRGPGGVARIAHYPDRRARRDRLVREEGPDGRLVLEVTEKD